MSAQSVQVRQVITRSNAILANCLEVELFRALVCCKIAKLKDSAAAKLPYLMVAERTSAKFIKLHAQGKMVTSESILKLMIRLEEALGGTVDILSYRLPLRG